MTSWEIILDLFPQDKQLELTKLEEDYLPVYATQAFAAYYKDTRCIFAYFVQSAIWCEGIGNIWQFTSDNTELVPRKFRYLVHHLDKVENFDFVLRTAQFHGKQIKWDIESDQ